MSKEKIMYIVATDNKVILETDYLSKIERRLLICVKI